jgi:hypothetical protein
MMERQDPKQQYSSRLQQRRRLAAELHRLHINYGNARLLIAGIAGGAAWASFGPGLISPLWLVAPIGLFLVLAVLHDLVLRKRARARRAGRYYESGLARIEDRWPGSGEPGNRFKDDSHVYSADLDLFGKGSLFELLSTSRTRAGEEFLARWLKEPAPLDEIRRRHAAVDELRNMVDLRERLAMAGHDVHSGVNPRALWLWSLKPPLLEHGALRMATRFLPVLAAVTVFFWWWKGMVSPFLAVLAFEAGVALALRKPVLRVVHTVEQAKHDLDLLAEVLKVIESCRFTSQKMMQLRAVLDTAGRPPSHQIWRLHILTDLLDSRDNVMVRVVGPPLMWTTQLAFALETWRERNGPSVRRWLEALAEMGALTSLATYAYEHPGDPFPEFVENGGAVFEADGLGHPLLPAGRFVRNDVRLGGDLRALVVSGSNMSGKTTLLRTIGVNVVLAMAGAPVRARRLCMSPVSLGASIRITDSLQGGTSRFYAEITRLRAILDLAGKETSLLFLLDELLNGTNSHDRRIGAEAVVRGLISRRAIGLVTTHDLALADIAQALDPHAANVHFEDHLENGKISFDYLLRPGVVTKSNALELMRSVGLEV